MDYLASFARTFTKNNIKYKQRISVLFFDSNDSYTSAYQFLKSICHNTLIACDPTNVTENSFEEINFVSQDSISEKELEQLNAIVTLSQYDTEGNINAKKLTVTANDLDIEFPADAVNDYLTEQYSTYKNYYIVTNVILYLGGK